MNWFFQPIPAAGQTSGAAPDNSQPAGWYAPLGRAFPVNLSIAAIAASGLIWCPQPIAAAPTNEVTIDKWQQPLSIAPKTAHAVHTPPSFVSLPFAEYPVGWHQPLSKAAPLAKAPFVDVPLVPRDTQFTQNTTTIDRWQQPLSVVAKPPPRGPFTDVPFAPRDIQFTQNTSTIDKWQQPLVAAVKVAGPVHSQPTFVVPPFEVPRGWHQPLSGAPLTAKAVPSEVVVPFTTTQAVDNTVTIEKWQQPLSVAVPVARTVNSQFFVPFNTAQTVATTPYGWLQPLSSVVQRAVAVPTQPTFVVFTPGQPQGWYQPLSVAVPVAKAQTQPAWTPAPFDTLSIAWVQPLSVAPQTVKAFAAASLYVPQPPVADVVAESFVSQWLVPLSVAVRAYVAPLGGLVLVSPDEGGSVTPPDVTPTVIPEVAWPIWEPTRKDKKRAARLKEILAELEADRSKAALRAAEREAAELGKAAEAEEERKEYQRFVKALKRARTAAPLKGVSEHRVAIEIGAALAERFAEARALEDEDAILAILLSE